ncbi:glycosyltransferase family 2 protein [Cereibacter sphaeroides]|uniref:glycosyltransferase family 2 protein n=1 Tax=Cereibacter sphaeroides TaxID=1063 RepID=UPI001F198095|nr:glycosyltransferase family A protein [Cereibacter sphaeroides]MCE6958678.1 glycosyltransferase family 2 protein [Cereibacter sphaeroides]MCE6973439.1 glycosyltransferase family 2 protein [Cereibacter sphaeroides]
MNMTFDGASPADIRPDPLPLAALRSGDGPSLPAGILVAIATTGRPEVLSPTLAAVAGQSRPPDRILVCVAGSTDLRLDPAIAGLGLLAAPKGLTRQRNAILDRVRPGEIVLFLDDDFLPAPDYLERLEAGFLAHPEVVMMTGRVLADGICGPGLTHAQAARLVAEAGPAPPAQLTQVHNGYGCNMAFRAGPVLGGLRFDERLPLYGWLEDVDFSRRLAPFGRIVRNEALRGVHLGVKSGRTSGLRLGYSQVANPLYLIGKRSMAPRRALAMLARNLVANGLKSLRPEPWTDRRGRLRGNLIALGDLVRGRMRPERALDLP